MIPGEGEHLCDLPRFFAAMEARSTYWGQMLRDAFASGDVVEFQDLRRQFASIGFDCTRRTSNEYNTFWQLLFEKTAAPTTKE